MSVLLTTISLFFFNNPATTEIYTLSLHDALPISDVHAGPVRIRGGHLGESGAPPVLDAPARGDLPVPAADHLGLVRDRKSTRLNSSHTVISYAVFCLKKKKRNETKSHTIHEAAEQ